MQDYKGSAEEYIQQNIFYKTGETFFDFSLGEDYLYQQLDFIGKKLCLKFVGDYSGFYLIDSYQVQAGAIHKHQVVLVYKGMLELIFRTSAVMLGAERHHKKSDENFYEPWFDNVNLWINGGEFEWSNDQYWWLHDKTHRKVFDMLVEAMFVFLVLHEIGHFHNLHGDRRNDFSKKNPLSMDNIIFIHRAVGDTEAIDEAEKFDAHAREIIADTYAFQFMLSELKECLFPGSEYEGIDAGILSVKNFDVCIYVVASFFWALSFKRPMRNDSQNANYPSQVFRLASIEAASLEHKVCMRNDTLTRIALEIGMDNYIKKLTCASNNKEFIEWRLTMNIPANKDHYEKICAITKKWSNLMFGVRDEELAEKLRLRTRTFGSYRRL